MDEFLIIISKVGLGVLGLVGLALVPFGLPGLWILVIAGFGIPLIEASANGIPLLEASGWLDFWILVGAAILAEFLEMAFSIGIAKKTGAGRQGMFGAFLGGFAGAILMTPFFPPIGTLFGAAVGSFGGAFLLEFVFGERSRADSLKIGKGAMMGAILGRIFKLWLGIFQWVWLLWALFV